VLFKLTIVVLLSPVAWAAGVDEDLALRYLLAELKKIAAGPESELKNWLKRFLTECENTVEKREIQALLPGAPLK
jgi:hypothetical protein